MAKWAIDNMEHTLPDGGVFAVYWRVNEILHDVSGVTYSATAFSSLFFTPDPDSPSYIPYAELTEGIVLTWVHDALGKETVAAYEESLAANIQNQKNPPISGGLPWSQV